MAYSSNKQIKEAKNTGKKQSAVKNVWCNFVGFMHEHKHTIALVFAALIAAPLIISAIFTKPIADDQMYFSISARAPWEALAHGYNNNGRAMHELLISWNVVLPDKLVPPLAAIFLLATLIVASTFLSYMILTYIKRDQGQPSKRLLVATTMGSFMALAIIYSSYSIADSFLWWTASTVYIPSIIFGLLLAGISIKLIFSKKELTIKTFFKSKLAWAFVAIMASGMFFNEIFDILIIGFFTAAIIMAPLMYKLKVINKSTRNKALLVMGVGIVVGLLGFFAMVESPGNIHRRSLVGTKFDFYKVIVEPLNRLDRFSYLASPEIILLIVSLGILLAGAVPKLRHRTAILATGTGLLYIIGAGYVFLAVFGYVSSGFYPNRAFIVPGAFFVIITALIIAMWLRSIFKKVEIPGLVLVTILAITVLACLRSTKPLVGATIMRYNAYNNREYSIARQLQNNPDRIFVTSLLLLDGRSEGADITLSPMRQADWYVKAFRKYYKIPAHTKIAVLRQNEGYCTAGHIENVEWWGYKNCQTLLDERIKQEYQSLDKDKQFFDIPY